MQGNHCKPGKAKAAMGSSTKSPNLSVAGIENGKVSGKQGSADQVGKAMGSSIPGFSNGGVKAGKV